MDAQVESSLPDEPAQPSEKERRVRVNEIARHIAENSRELIERLVRGDEHGSKPT